MKFVILVPLAWLPLLIVVIIFVEVLGDYLFTMVAWFVLALIADVILYDLLMPLPLDAARQFAICLLLIPVLAPFIGCYVRDKREQRRRQREADLKRAERERQDLSYLNYLQQQEELERAERKKYDEQYLLGMLERELSDFIEAEAFRPARVPPQP
jgi:hypothetical protein